MILNITLGWLILRLRLFGDRIDRIIGSSSEVYAVGRADGDLFVPLFTLRGVGGPLDCVVTAA